MSSQQGGNASAGTAMKARSRPTRQAAQQHKYADMKQDGLNGGYPGGAEDEPTPASYGTEGGDPDARVDLEKMKIQALRKYTKVYELPMVHPQSSKEDLVAAVKKHWSMVSVSEDTVVQNLMRLRTRGGGY